MSSDYSNFERDYFRKPKRREDVKSSKISPKGIKVYEPKSAQKSIKTQGYADESEQSSCYEHNYHTSYTQSAKKKSEGSSAFQQRSSSRKKQRGSNKFKALQDNEESHKDKAFKLDIIWVPTSKPKIPSPLAEKSGLANNSNPTTLSSEGEHPIWEESLMKSPGQSTAATLNDSKSIELFNFSQDRLDPIQILKASLKKERQRKVDIAYESPENTAENKEEKRNEKDHQGEIEENDGTNYSDIDNLVEEKLLNNNHAKPDLDDVISNHLDLEKKEAYLEELENKERPIWEDIDTQQILEDIKTSKNLELFSQQTILPSKTKQDEVPQSDNFDKFFSFEIREEPIAVEPDLFNLGMKFSSDKRPRASLQNNDSLCSQSFDMELIDRRKNKYKPLPAFRNFCIQKETSEENVSKGPMNYSLQIDHLNNDGGPNNMNFPLQIFCNLIPNIHIKVWFYLDLEDIVQGPFSSQVMDSWYNKGYLPLDLDITIKNGHAFRKIKDLIEIAFRQRSANYLPLPSAQNRSITAKIYQNDEDLDETEKEINNSIENILSENCCPNIKHTFRQNSAPETLKVFSDRSQVPLTKHQSQGFDNRFNYNNATYLRNLPR